jgi:PleD family two-component response regulator
VEEHEYTGGFRLTVRLGVDEYHGGTWEELFTEVDQYVYIAWHQGGNRVGHPEV